MRTLTEATKDAYEGYPLTLEELTKYFGFSYSHACGTEIATKNAVEIDFWGEEIFSIEIDGENIEDIFPEIGDPTGPDNTLCYRLQKEHYKYTYRKAGII